MRCKNTSQLLSHVYVGPYMSHESRPRWYSSASERSTTLVTRPRLSRVSGSPKKSRPAVFAATKRHVSSFFNPGSRERETEATSIWKESAPRLSCQPTTEKNHTLLPSQCVLCPLEQIRISQQFLSLHLTLCRSASREGCARFTQGVRIGSAPASRTYMGTTISSTSIIVPPKWGVLLGRVLCYNLAKE